MLTISNQITASSAESPVTVDGRKLRRVSLWHFSWWRVITDAIVQSRYRGVSDPDQAWILDELIAYLDHDASGAGGFTDMGEHWVAVRKAAHDGTLRPSPEARDVAERWEAFTQYLCLGLSQDLGENVTVLRPRKQTTAMRLDEAVRRLTSEGRLETSLRVPGAVGDIDLRADLRTRQTLVRVGVSAPDEMRAKPRINWLLRQLKEAPSDLRVDVVYPNARQTAAGLLADVVDAPERLLYEPDLGREPRAFFLTLSRRMGQKRGKEEGSFVRETRNQIVDFYGDLVQNLKPWQARAPRLRESDLDEPVEVAQPAPPAYSDRAARDAGEAVEPAVG